MFLIPPSLQMLRPDGYVCHDIDLRASPTISSSDHAWAGGFFDGEGSTSITKNNNKYSNKHIRISIRQASANGVPETLIRFKKIVGGIGNITKVGSYHYNKNWTPSYDYSCYTKVNVNSILSLLWPHLGDIKRQQAIKCGFQLIGG